MKGLPLGFTSQAGFLHVESIIMLMISPMFSSDFGFCFSTHLLPHWVLSIFPLVLQSSSLYTTLFWPPLPSVSTKMETHKIIPNGVITVQIFSLWETKLRTEACYNRKDPGLSFKVSVLALPCLEVIEWSWICPFPSLYFCFSICIKGKG